MSEKEKCEFQIKLKIKDQDGKIQELNKKVYLEITWLGNKGILNPGTLRTYDHKYSWGNYSGTYRRSKGEIIRFEKDGKSYDVVVKIEEIRKGWFKDRVVELSTFPAPNSNFSIFLEDEGGRIVKPPKPNEPENMISEANPSQKIIPNKLRWQGLVLVGVIIFLVVLLIVIIAYFQRKK